MFPLWNQYCIYVSFRKHIPYCQSANLPGCLGTWNFEKPRIVLLRAVLNLSIADFVFSVVIAGYAS